ncbi:5-formyltetrahydrofolate cyclo-ligase [Alicyclobacillus mengziensis]|uniref:5-formyltetrahydrofolate cyclo-ligase n=1 Tax=Alicyclobacillus mengziensis TaxID=2931921 RepID=A0A9X7VXS0_9BACL|nr:5-formyltetrahydrofolate cyclo-ligase [Alicyclobacillus mengziensis]QSO46978.1 5-formyltetrahydrofolate cyclo-ligase [Alicyclobacillus mengziensis]
MRKKFIDIRGQLDESARRHKGEQLSTALTEYLLGLSISSGVIALYRAFRSEVDIWSCTSRLFDVGWRVVVPITDTPAKQLRFAEVTPQTMWRRGVLGISEPAVEADEIGRFPYIDAGEISAFCVPGVAFTETGLRLGYGGGYYDRLFAQPKVTGRRIGIALECQVTEKLPGETHDIRMNDLATEAGVRPCR